MEICGADVVVNAPGGAVVIASVDVIADDHRSSAVQLAAPQIVLIRSLYRYSDQEHDHQKKSRKMVSYDAIGHWDGIYAVRRRTTSDAGEASTRAARYPPIGVYFEPPTAR